MHKTSNVIAACSCKMVGSTNRRIIVSMDSRARGLEMAGELQENRVILPVNHFSMAL